jgi:SAM-dependent methyltransferase
MLEESKEKQQKKPGEDNFWRTLQTQIRRRRFVFFQKLLATLPRPLSLLDVGGTEEFWKKMSFQEQAIDVLLYNLTQVDVSYPGLKSLAGDARTMHEFQDTQFDVVFSNSVIEHVGNYQQQRQMACEVRRVGKRYCIQTPNRYFPLEPHVLLPFFQFLPFWLKVFILTHFRSPWGWKLAGRTEALAYVREIRLLSEKELRALFPGAQIYREKFLGMTKSFVVYKGW